MIEKITLKPVPALEWQTLGLIFISYGFWFTLALGMLSLPPIVWIVLSALNLTLFMSILHEVVHRHPTRSDTLNSFFVLLPIGWSIPYERFRDTHLEHHMSGELTDPFDDPESCYLPSQNWRTMGRVLQQVYLFNNTLAGRMLIGPVISLGQFYLNEIRSILGTPEMRLSLIKVWIKHLLLVGVLIWIIATASPVPFWQWALAIYLGHSVLLIRTFLEHQAAPDQNERTVIIEKPCPLAFLFLFNNYHFVHHDMPGCPWYRLPGIYRKHGKSFTDRNGAYVYRSYGEIIRKYFFTPKEPVAHPFLRLEEQD